MSADGASSVDASDPKMVQPLKDEVERLRTALAESRRTERDLSDTFSNVPIPMHWVGPDGTILRANQAELDLLGYSHDEYVGHHIGEFHADEEVSNDLLRRLHADEIVRDYPARLRCRDGSIRHVLIDSSSYREQGRFVHTRCFTRDLTTQMQMQDEIRRDQERIRLAAQASDDLIWDWDVPNGRVSWAGSTWDYFGSSVEDMIDPVQSHSVWARRVHPDDLAHAEAAARAAFVSGARSWEHEYRFRRLSGVYARMLERAAIVRDSGGRPMRVVGVMRDVSQRKAAEDATLRLVAIVASASDAIVGKTMDGMITSWNAAAERIFGYSEHEMVGKSVFTLIPEEHHAAEQELLARIRQGARVDVAITERFRNDGTRISISLTVSPIWDASGVVVGVSSIMRDITERKRAEEELARREQRYRALVTAASSLVWTADPAGGFVEPQTAWENYTGQAWEQHRDLGWMSALHPEDRESLKTSWHEAMERGKPHEANLRIWHDADHRYRHCISRAAPVHGPDGSVREWIGTLTDIEDQIVVEERLRQADRLESVGRLAGGVAHEANNQMTVVLGTAAFLLRQVQDERGREDLDHIRRAAQRTAAITQQLLAFSRRQILQPQIVDLNVTIRRLEPVLQRALGESSRATLRLAADLGRVKADPGQLDQVLLNLAFNARDAMTGGGVLTIETANVTLDDAYVASKGLRTMLPGQYAMLMVSDTGHGMDKETLGRIFEPFFTTKEVGEGTGLGLSTVYGIVKQSGGFVWAFSEPGHGTAFKIYLPVITSSPVNPGAPLPESVDGGSETILIAEDDTSVRGIMARALREYGYTVLEAGDGAEALQIVSNAPVPPSLVIADVMMPRLNGQQFSRELHKRWPNIPVLFMSGYTSLDSVSRGVLQEGREFLQKPFEPDVLAGRIRTILKAANQGRSQE